MKKQPGSRHCFVCGVENKFGLHVDFYSIDERSIFAEIAIPEHFQGYPDTVHGGILATLLDETLGRTFLSKDPERLMYTAKLNIKYRHPVPIETKLKIVGTIIKDRGRVGEAKAEVLNSDGKVLAEATGVVVNLPDDIHTDDLEEMGWKVYEDKKELI